MTTQKFDGMPTPSEAMNVDDISADKVKEAWQGYEAKPEYKKFNKHDLIESMQNPLEHSEQALRLSPKKALQSERFFRAIIFID